MANSPWVCAVFHRIRVILDWLETSNLSNAKYENDDILDMV